jgi:hypothetical protein
MPGWRCISLVIIGRKQKRGGTVVDDHVLVPIMQTIIDVMPIAWIIIIVGDGDGGGGNNGGGVDPRL